MLANELNVTMCLEFLTILVFLFIALKIIQRRWFSPISDIPGPFFGSFSVFWQIWHIIKGHTETATIALHKKHGDFVRIAYNEVSVGHPVAIDAILKSEMNKVGLEEFLK